MSFFAFFLTYGAIGAILGELLLLFLDKKYGIDSLNKDDASKVLFVLILFGPFWWIIICFLLSCLYFWIWKMKMKIRR